MSTQPHQSGLGLVELMIGLVVTVVLLAVVSQTVRVSSRLTTTSMTNGRLEEHAAQALQLLGTELRWAQPSALLITTEANSTRLDYVIAAGYDGNDPIWSAPVAVRYVPSSVDADANGFADEGSLVRTQNGVDRVLCRNVRSGGFSVTEALGRVQMQLTIFGLSKQRELFERQVDSTTSLVNPTGV